MSSEDLNNDIWLKKAQEIHTELEGSSYPHSVEETALLLRLYDEAMRGISGLLEKDRQIPQGLREGLLGGAQHLVEQYPGRLTLQGEPLHTLGRVIDYTNHETATLADSINVFQNAMKPLVDYSDGLVGELVSSTQGVAGHTFEQTSIFDRSKQKIRFKPLEIIGDRNQKMSLERNLHFILNPKGSASEYGLDFFELEIKNDNDKDSVYKIRVNFDPITNEATSINLDLNAAPDRFFGAKLDEFCNRIASGLGDHNIQMSIEIDLGEFNNIPRRHKGSTQRFPSIKANGTGNKRRLSREDYLGFTRGSVKFELEGLGENERPVLKIRHNLSTHEYRNESERLWKKATYPITSKEEYTVEEIEELLKNVAAIFLSNPGELVSGIKINQ